MYHRGMDTIALDYTLMEALMAYLDYGLHPGSGGRAILLLDANYARPRMHEISRHTTEGMIEFVRRHFPEDSFGSQENIDAWINSGGIFADDGEAALYRLDHPKYDKIKIIKRICGYKPLGKQ